MAEKRLDIALKDSMNISRQKASELIKLSLVRVNNKIINKPSYIVSEDDSIVVDSSDDVLKYVSRGGYKLERAIDKFSININNKVCADIGASTGGFTHCMLQNGAKIVYTYDVGSNQLAEIIRNDSRVIVNENTDVRDVKDKNFADFVSCDVSFISLRHILPVIYRFLNDKGEAVILVKPQFEAGREFLNKKGIVKNPKVHKKVLKDIIEGCKLNNLYPRNLSYSPIKGGDGNIEYILYISRTMVNLDIDLDNIIEEGFNNLK